MIRICALNESSSDRDSDNETQVETREAQEANLLNLYTSALKAIAAGNIISAKNNLNEIISNPIFQEEKDDALARSLRYNVHKNLGECLLKEGDVETAQREMLTAADIDSGDITLWFKIAGTCVKLNNLYMCRSALEQGLLCSPKHWPSIDNLVTVTFKLGDFLACLGYCAMLQELDPTSEKVILYKSKVYNEMPFLREAYNDQDFVPIHTEIETFHAERKPEPAREPLMFDLKELTVECLAESLFDLNNKCDELGTTLNPIDTGNAVDRLVENRKRIEEAKIKVSVQNLVEDIIDIIEEEEEVENFVEDVLDDLLCKMFGVEPKKMSEKISAQILDGVLSSVFERSNGPPKKKSVVIEAKPRERKKVNPLEEIPDELIEKRRSSRKSRVQEVAATLTSDTSNDQINIQSPKELLRSFLPANLKLGKDNSCAKTFEANKDATENVSKSLFEKAEEKKTWYNQEEEKKQVEKFLCENNGKTIWHLMRAFLDYIFRLDARLLWPQGLANWSGKIYEAWRNHLADPLDNAEEKFSREFLRYYIIGSECIVGTLLENQSEDPIPENLRLRLEQDLTELDYVQHGLPIDLQLRIHSLRFYFFCLTDNEDDVLYESGQITHIYNEHPEMVVFNSIPQYKIASRKYLEEYSTGINRNKELEELNQYYENKRYAEIVDLLLKTLESTCVTPGKETSRTPDKETQIDILVESLFHVEMYVKCLKWCTYALCSTFAKMIVDSETGDPKKLTPHCWTVIDSYLQTIHSCLLNTEKKDFAETTFDTGSKLASVLIQILCIQIDQVSSSDVGFDPNLPWIILHKLIVWAESYVVTDLDKSWEQEEMKGSMSLLCSAHDYLGQKSCCTNQNGSLLNYILDVFLPILLSADKPYYADQIKSNLDQAIYCLFSHPSKKSRVRHLSDHGVSQVALTWERAAKLYQYIKPEKIPEHDDVKLLSISLDSESFMKRLFALIPAEVGLEKRREVAKLFIQGKKDKMKLKNLKKLPEDLRDVLYLLADYCFKNSKDLDRAIDFYTLDISFNPDRYDSWAALALAQASKMDQRLNSCKKLVPTKMLENTVAVETCFKKCLEMNDGNSNLWIEYGNFSYNVHSYISRTLQNNSEEMSLEDFEVLNSKKESLLSTALENYKQTLRIFEKDGIDENDVDERWLIHYMIGKIHEKTNSSIVTSLNCYITSMNCLASNGAILPRKVNYNSPQSMSLETLEIYYRIHATILKHLVNEEVKLDLETREALYEIMKTVQLSKVYNTNAQENHTVRFSMKRKIESSSAAEPIDKVPRSDESSTSIMRDVIEVMDSMIDEVDFITDTNKHEVSKLIKLALHGLEDVAFHFFHHFKALYRLAHYYYNSDKVKNLGKVQKLLLAGANERNVLCPGLFFGRKPNQIFNDVWRIPISEIDRPGSFASHCSKSLMLLIDVLKSLGDLNTLTDIALQLRKPPTEENKFVHESDRLEVGTMANTYLFNSIKTMVNNVSVEKEALKPAVILDIYRIYQKIQKQWPGREKEMLMHLKELYSKIKGRTDKDKIPNEEVTKFCNLEISRQRSNQSSRNNQGAGSAYTAQAFKPPTVVSQASPAPAFAEMNISKLAQVSADIVKITTFQETSALALPNMTNEIIAAQSNFKYSDSPRLVNGLFQTLKSLTQAQLRSLNFDLVKLDAISKFAVKIGLVYTSVNDYVAQIRKILNGTTTKPSVAQKKPVATPSTKPAGSNNAQKTNLGRPPQFKPNKMTPAQRNLKNFQLLLQQQSSPVEAAKSIMASNNVTITSGFQKKAQTPQTSSPVAKPSAQAATKPSVQTVSPNVQVKSRFTTGVQAKSNIQTVQRPGLSLSGQSSSPGTLKQRLPAGITLTMEKKTQAKTGTTTQVGPARPANNAAVRTQKNQLASFRAQVQKELSPGQQTYKKNAPVQRNKPATAAGTRKPPAASNDEPEIICID